MAPPPRSLQHYVRPAMKDVKLQTLAIVASLLAIGSLVGWAAGLAFNLGPARELHYLALGARSCWPQERPGYGRVRFPAANNRLSSFSNFCCVRSRNSRSASRRERPFALGGGQPMARHGKTAVRFAKTAKSYRSAEQSARPRSAAARAAGRRSRLKRSSLASPNPCWPSMGSTN